MSHYDNPWKSCKSCIYIERPGELINLDLCGNGPHIIDKGIVPYCDDMNDGDCTYYKQNTWWNRFKRKRGISL